MKTFKFILMTLFLLIFLVGCVDEPEDPRGEIAFSGLVDTTFYIGDDLPDYLTGVTITNELGDPITEITVDDGEVDYETPGIYHVYFTVLDDEGEAVSQKIYVIVKIKPVEIDYTQPYFVGVANVYYTIGEEIPDYQAHIQAFDDVDGELTNQIIFEGDVDFETPGTYQITITVYDSFGNRKIDQYQVLVMNNTAPVLFDYHRVYYFLNDDAPDYFAYIQANDLEDGDLTDQIGVIDDLVQLDIPGIYPLTYYVEDSYGLRSEQVISVQVMASSNETIDTLNVYNINDTHGSILETESDIGLAKIGGFLLDATKNKPEETMFVAGGDILQGNILSNYYHGASMIDLLNVMNLDIFVLGNHEFDWGIEMITRYFNPFYEDIQAEYPLLGANVFYEGTTTRPDYIDAYAIIPKGDLKIGVVGTMGYGLESSIARSRIEGYQFANPTTWTNYYINLLIEDFDVDAVFVVTHAYDTYFNDAVSANPLVKGVFTGHLHANKVEKTQYDVPVIQSLSNARALGYMSYAVVNKTLINTGYGNYYKGNSNLNTSHQGLSTIIQDYANEIDGLMNDVILTAAYGYSRDALTTFMAQIIRESANADIGVHNYGGTRDSLAYHEPMTVATTYRLFPFDNQIISALISGQQVISLAQNSSVALDFKPGLSLQNIQANEWYWVSTNDYVFGNYKQFQTYQDIYYPEVVDRTAFENELRRRSETTDYFIID